MGKFDYDALTSEQKERLQSFFAVTFALNEKELEAIDGVTPMTQELFDSIVDKCTGCEFDAFIYALLLKYPEFLKNHAERIEAELDAKPMPEGWHDPSPEKMQEEWEKLCACIREKP